MESIDFYDPLMALDDSYLPLEVFERVFSVADSESLRAFASACKFFAEETSKDMIWHRIFDAKTFYCVPNSAKTWKEKFRLKKPYDTLLAALKACEIIQPDPEDATSAPSPYQRVIIPPGKHSVSIMHFHHPIPFYLEGYIPQDAEDDSGSSNGAKAAASISRPIISGRVFLTHGGSLQNLTFAEDEIGTISVLRGEFTMDNCELINSRYGIFIYRNVTKAKITRSRFDGVSNWCIVPDEEANVEVEDCDFVNFPGRGISAQTTGEVIIRRCRFSHGIKEAQAVVSRAGSKTLVEECVFEQPNVSYAAVSALPMPNRPVSTEGYLKVMNCTFRNFKLTAVYIKDIFAEIDSCIFVDGSAAIQVAQCENVTRPVQITGNTISHCRSGVVVHSRGIATLAENRIFNNSGKGISISADSKRILSDDNEVHDNGGGDIIAQPFDQDAFDTGYKEDEIHPHVQEAIDAGKCTYTATENNYYNQLVFRCRTCNLVGSEGMCVVCKDICHKGHDITVDEPKMSSFFCDCGALLNCKACK